MAMDWRKAEFCCLCGKPILAKEVREEFKVSRAHTPPKQFYPKEIRDGLNLWIAAAHKRCNNSRAEDESSFYTQLYACVANENEVVAKLLLDDIGRQAANPQMRSKLRGLLKNIEGITKSGIHLPPGVVCLKIKMNSICRVVVSIAQGLSQYHDGHFLVADTCVDIRLIEKLKDTPALYQPDQVDAEEFSVDPRVFSYQRFGYGPEDSDELYKVYTMLFWGAFRFGVAFQVSGPSFGDSTLA